jgi:hypothetical protein
MCVVTSTTATPSVKIAKGYVRARNIVLTAALSILPNPLTGSATIAAMSVTG